MKSVRDRKPLKTKISHDHIEMDLMNYEKSMNYGKRKSFKSAKKCINIWTTETLEEIISLSNIIENKKMSEPLGCIASHYIEKHRKMEKEYDIHTRDPVELDETVLLIAYICDIRMCKLQASGKKYIKKDKTTYNMTVKDFYTCLGDVMYETMHDLLKCEIWTLNYDELYMIDLISGIMPIKKSINKSCIQTSYYLMKNLMKLIENTRNGILMYMPCLYVRSQELDISFISKDNMKDILRILGTKRKIFVRIFFVLAYSMIREDFNYDNNWVRENTNISNIKDFISMLENIVMEMSIAIVSWEIMMKKLL